MVLGDLDKLRARSTSAHIQLNIKDKPENKKKTENQRGWLVGITTRYRLMIQGSGKKRG